VTFNIKDRALNAELTRNLEEAQAQRADALEKLSSGTIFTRNDPRPSERAIADGLEFKLRSLASAKRNINTGVSLLQTAESGLSEIANMILRMKEINVAAASTTVTDKERRFLFIEYEALHDEVDRVARTTSFNGLPLLNGASPDVPDALVLRIGDPTEGDDGSGPDDNDVNVLRFDGLKQVIATTAGLGLKSARDLLSGTSENDGLSLADVEDLLTPDSSDGYATIYDQALDTLSTQRAVFGGMQSRLNRALDYTDVYQENIAAAKSKIADTDYATEVGKLAEAEILTHAGTAVLAQSNVTAQLALKLLQSIG
jgi:flagellin